MSCSRYSFNLFKGYVWKGMWTKRFWTMWGVKQTLKYMISDTKMEKKK